MFSYIKAGISFCLHFVLFQVVCQCCEEADPSSVLEKLMSKVKEGQMGEEGLIKLLRTVKQSASSSYPTQLLPLLEELERSMRQPDDSQTGGKDEHWSTGSNMKENVVVSV